VLLRVDRGKTVEQPVYLLSVSTDEGVPLFFAQRNRIVLEPLSSLSVIEQHLSLDEQSGFQARQTLVEVGDSAHLEYYSFQNENQSFYHLNQVHAEVKENANFRSHSIDFGGKLVRNTVRVALNGKGSEATLNGLYLGNGEQHMDNHTTIVHAVPNGTSTELYQGILDDRATGVFSGLILVRPDAQQTDAQQSNNCLLLSEQARIDSKPQLEIYADDVKCTHGATVGQLDEEEIFYLRSRGISEDAARTILTYAFAERVIEQIKIESFKEQVDTAFNAKFKKQFNRKTAAEPTK
jgi:Fe-S cluster assembly protein SufD